MINLFKKLIILSLILLNLSSCVFTPRLWVARNGGDRIGSFFIDKEKKRVVLIGDQHPITKKGDYYSLSDPEGKLVRVFELGRRGGETIKINLDNMEATGSEMFGWMWVGFKMNNLTDEEMEFLNERNMNIKKAEGFFGQGIMFNQSKRKYPYTEEVMKRYPSTLETLTNLCSYEEPQYKQIPNVIYDKNGKYLKTLSEPKLKLIAQPKPKATNSPNCIPITTFDQPWQGVIHEEYTTSEKATRVIATPFTLAVDTLLLPIIAPLFIHSMFKQSTTDYWCQGEFCGYDKKQKNSTKQNPPLTQQPLPIAR